jgi:hypothetical protein
MSIDRLTALEERIARLEAGVVRDPIDVVPSRASSRGGAFLAGAVTAVVAGYFAAAVGAQAPRRAPITVPFSVTDSKGDEILSVFAGGVKVRGALYIAKSTGNIFAAITSSPGSAGLAISSDVTVPTGSGQAAASTPALFMGTKGLKGYLEINDESGNKMIEAGSLKDGIGYVLATPYRSSVGPNGNPSVLMGRAGR